MREAGAERPGLLLRQGRRVAGADALAHVAGYAVMNGYSGRAWQKGRGGQWSKGKSGDTLAPGLKLNAPTTQAGNTADLSFGVAHVLNYISHFMTLLPGDVVSTGTPSGAGAGHQPGLYPTAGAGVEATVAGLGTQRQKGVAVAGGAGGGVVFQRDDAAGGGVASGQKIVRAAGAGKRPGPADGRA